ncbi:MAG: PUR family DNA/RNA-binding protein [Bacteroidales bacterium]|nr:PUR family DNA/RNA-binding protein [Bacteroidales bacterium]
MMEENEMNEKEELFSKAVRAGKRTYFFDVKTTKGDEKYITITESKRRFDNDQNRFTYEKHKIFLYKEDFEKVAKGLNDAIHYVQTGEYPEDYNEEPVRYNSNESESPVDSAIDKWFDELEKNNGEA